LQDPSNTEKIEQPLYWPEALLAFARAEARRLDRTISWLVQRAWKLASGRIRGIPSTEQAKGHTVSLVDTPKSKMNLFIPADMLEEMKAEAARFDRSMSWLVNLTLTLARPDLENIPTPEEIDEP
jgi:uncharacterized small protein (TIGR04563 family)